MNDIADEVARPCKDQGLINVMPTPENIGPSLFLSVLFGDEVRGAVLRPEKSSPNAGVLHIIGLGDLVEADVFIIPHIPQYLCLSLLRGVPDGVPDQDPFDPEKLGEDVFLPFLGPYLKGAGVPEAIGDLLRKGIGYRRPSCS